MFIWIDHNIFRIEPIQDILKQWNATKGSYFKFYGGKKIFSCIVDMLDLVGIDLVKNWKGTFQTHR